MAERVHVSDARNGTLELAAGAGAIAAALRQRGADIRTALARDGHDWEVLHGDVPLVASLVKSYIRHDLFVQRMYADLPNELEALYGPGLLQLSNLSGGDWSGEAAEAAASES